MSLSLVYLSGPVAGRTFSQAMGWREYASRSFPPHIQAISPVRAARALDTGQPIRSDIGGFPLSTGRAINTQSRFDIKRSDAVLVNLLGATELSIGTVIDVARAYDHQVPVVLAMEPEGNLHDHSMLLDCVSVRVSDLDEAIAAVTALVSTQEKYIWTRLDQIRMLMEEKRLNLTIEPLKRNYPSS